LGWPSIPKVAFVALVVFLLFASLARLSERAQQIWEIVQRIEDSQGALWALSGISVGPKVLLPLGAWGIRPPAALALAQVIALHRPHSIVELGPGASTLLILQAASSVPYDVHLTSIEHDSHFYDRAERFFSYLDLTCNLILAPLEEWEGNGYRVEWYAQDRISGVKFQVDLLVVDGPPAHDGIPRRFPAFPVFREALSPGGLVFVDDTDRHEDRKSVEMWCRMDDDLKILQDGGSFMILQLDG
jgi:hypothetical protein